MNAPTILAPTVGRKRIKPTGKARTVRERFSHRLSDLWGDRPIAELGDKCGVTADAASKWLSGITMPDVEKWPAIAKACGLKSAKELIPFD